MNILCFLLLLAVMILLLWRRYMKGRHRDMTLALVWFFVDRCGAAAFSGELCR